MSSQLVFAGAAFGRHFVFAPKESDVLQGPEVRSETAISPKTVPGQRKLPAFATSESFELLFPSPAAQGSLATASTVVEPTSPEPGFPELPFLDPDFSDTEFPGADLPEEDVPAVQRLPELPKLSSIRTASHLEIRPSPIMVASGISQMDALTGGLPRGCLSEICGPSSSGRTSLMLSATAAATRRQEACVLIDASDALDPKSLAASGVQLDQLLWVRCGAAGDSAQEPAHGNPAKARHNDRGEFCALGNVLRITDLLLQSSGFGLVVIDLGDIAPRIARRIPLTTWFRFRRAVEHTDTALLVIAQQSCAQTCASLVLQCAGKKRSAASSQLAEKKEVQKFSGKISAPSHGEILEGLQVQVEIMRSRLERKPAASVGHFESRTLWAG
jgi:hypothetical protein